MRNIIPIMRLATLAGFFFCMVTFHGCDCTKETLSGYKCRTCTATYISTHEEAARQEACGEQHEREDKERAFFEKWNSTLITVECHE